MKIRKSQKNNQSNEQTDFPDIGFFVSDWQMTQFPGAIFIEGRNYAPPLAIQRILYFYYYSPPLSPPTPPPRSPTSTSSLILPSIFFCLSTTF